MDLSGKGLKSYVARWVKGADGLQISDFTRLPMTDAMAIAQEETRRWYQEMEIIFDTNKKIDKVGSRVPVWPGSGRKQGKRPGFGKTDSCRISPPEGAWDRSPHGTLKSPSTFAL